MSSKAVTVRLSDGRLLEVVEEGDPKGLLLVFHHGSPSGAVPFTPFDRAAARRGIRFVTYSRLGFGDSTRRPHRTVADCSGDVAAVADHLGADHFITLGWSGGGPHAIACAALLPDRVLAAATIAGVAPYDAEGLDWTAGMGEDNQIEYPLAARDPDALLEWMTPQIEEMANVAPEDVVEVMRSLVSDVDEACVSEEFDDFIARSFHRAFANGPWGWYDDDLAFVAPWGFDLGSITAPVSIWQGRQDLIVPFAHGEWLVEHIPTARPHLHPEHGHLSLTVGNIDEILDDLVNGVGRSWHPPRTLNRHAGTAPP